jgi:hypothetical protein
MRKDISAGSIQKSKCNALNPHETSLFRILIKSQDIKDILLDMLNTCGWIEYQRFAKYSLDNGLITSDELNSIDIFKD